MSMFWRWGQVAIIILWTYLVLHHTTRIYNNLIIVLNSKGFNMSKLCFFNLSRTLAQQKKHCLTRFAGINFFNASLFMDDDDDDDDDNNDDDDEHQL